MACSKCSAACVCRLKAVDTLTVDHTLTGSGSKASPWQLSSEVILTADAQVPNPDNIGTSGNLIKRGDDNGADDGIYVSCEDVQDCVGQLVNDVLSGIIYADEDNTFTVNVDTAVVVDCGLSGDGTAGDPITVELDPTADNALECATGPGGVGLYVPPAAVPDPVCVSDDSADCLIIDGDGCIELVVAPSPNADGCENALECTPEGLFVHKQLMVNERLNINPLADEMPAFNGGPRFHHNAQDPNGSGDPTDGSDIVIGQIANTHQCCDMQVQINGNLSNSPNYIMNQDLCAVAAAVRAFGPNNTAAVSVSTALDIFVDGVPHAVIGGRTLTINVADPSSGIEGCGVQVSQMGDAANFGDPLVIPAGTTVNIGYRLRSAAGVTGAGVDPAQAQFLYETLFKGIAPFPDDGGVTFPFTVDSSGFAIFGLTEDC